MISLLITYDRHIEAINFYSWSPKQLLKVVSKLCKWTMPIMKQFKAVVRACYRAYFVAHVSKYLAANFVSWRPA